MLRRGYKQYEVAEALGRSVSTINCEIKNGSIRKANISSNGDVKVIQVTTTYTALKAHHKAYIRRKYAKYQGMKIVGNKELRDFVDTHLLEFQTAESIAKRLRKGYDGLPYVSRSAIEKYVGSPYGRELEFNIHQHRKELRRYHAKRRPKPPDWPDGRLSIDERPDDIVQREHVGDVEADFVVSGHGGKGRILTIVDRKSRVGFSRKIYPVTVENIALAFLDVQRVFPELNSISTDNDILFVGHIELSQRLQGIPIFFCHPYHSWEKGTVENYNRKLREYIPKRSDISKYTNGFIQFAEDRLNNRFMNVIESYTPYEFLAKERALGGL